MNSVISDNVLDTNAVTNIFRNSHCIICGKPFNTARMGKLYCSAKCKQFGYNHKEKIFQFQNISATGINATPRTFYIEDFQFYDKRRKMLKRYKGLSRKKAMWEEYNSYPLTENEDFELYDLENDIEDEIISLNLKELSIEQWSFVKSLHPSFDGISFCELINSFGSDFFSQLNLSPTDRNTNENVIIKNKYINHCNLIAEGLIKFVKKPVNDENEN